MTRHASNWRKTLPLAALFFAVGCGVLIIALTQERGSRTNPNDPGPWFLPLALGASLSAGAVGLLVSRRTRENEAGDKSATRTRDLERNAEASEGSPATVWQTLAGLVLYVWALPWVGFLAATPVFAGLLMWRMEVSWWKAGLAAAGLTLAAFGLFSGVFKVPLPAGVWFS